MSRHIFLISAAMLIAGELSTSPSIAREAKDSRVNVRLVADVAAATPGSVLRLGVHFEIEDGWHIYWRNPGEAGLATDVEFELPAGLDVGPVQWPLPIVFSQSDGIPGYGYEGSVVLAAEVTVPEKYRRSQPGTLQVEVSWLACKGVCVLGSAEFEASLANLPVDPVFEGWRQSLPLAGDIDDTPFSMSSTGGQVEGTISHWLRWNQPPRSVEWFPYPSDALEVADVKVMTRGGLTRIDASVRPRTGASGSVEQLSSLVVATLEDGLRRGWTVSVNIGDKER